MSPQGSQISQSLQQATGLGFRPEDGELRTLVHYAAACETEEPLEAPPPER